MIAKIARRTDDTTGLIRYLYGAGPAGDAPEPHIVAGWQTPAELEPQQLRGGRRDFRRLTGLLEQTTAAPGARVRLPGHCVMRAAPEDRPLYRRRMGADRLT